MAPVVRHPSQEAPFAFDFRWPMGDDFDIQVEILKVTFLRVDVNDTNI